jgi:hypothetical protein
VVYVAAQCKKFVIKLSILHLPGKLTREQTTQLTLIKMCYEFYDKGEYPIHQS